MSRYQYFVKGTKKCLVSLIAMVSIIVSVSLITMLSGCDKKDQVSIPDSDDWKDMQVIMHGVRIKGAENMTFVPWQNGGYGW